MNDNRILRRFLSFPLFFFLILPWALPAQGSPWGILTNAEDGVYNSARRFWFSLERDEGRISWLRITLNGEEAYWGEGPASIILDAEPGEERIFEIRADRLRSPREADESLFFTVLIDRKPPAPPRVDMVIRDEGALFLEEREHSENRIAAFIHKDGEPRFIRDIDEMEGLPLGAYWGLVWAVDSAGNYSEPAPAHFTVPAFAVENPIPGVWANPQILSLSGWEDKEVFWTIDGSDPLGGEGKRYAGPVRLDKIGSALLRLAIISPQGEVREERIEYKILPEAASYETLSRLSAAEEQGVQGEFIIPTEPEDWISVAASPWRPGSETTTLRAVPGISRKITLHISRNNRIYRHVITLDGLDSQNPAPAARPSVQPGDFRPLPVFSPQGEPVLTPEEPWLLTQGICRVILWRNNPPIRYRWLAPGESPAAFFEEGQSGPSPWEEDYWEADNPPSPVYPPGGTLLWMANRGGVWAGPFILRIPALPITPAQRDRRGWFLYRYASPEQSREWKVVSPLMFLPQRDDRVLDVCDGEDVEWRFVSSEGETLDFWRKDRLAPSPPNIAGPREGAWQTHPVEVSALSHDPRNATPMIVRIIYPSEREEYVETLGTARIEIDPQEEYPALVTIEAWTEDGEGNVSPRVSRNFTFDPGAVYVEGGESPSGPGSGTKQDPYRRLDDALQAAAEAGFEVIRVSGRVALEGRAEIAGSLRLSGLTEDAAIALAENAGFTLQGELGIASCAVEREEGALPMWTLEPGSSLEIIDSQISHTGALAEIRENSRFTLLNSRVVSRGSHRETSLSASGGEILIKDSGWECETPEGILGELFQTRISLESSNFSLKTGGIGGIFRLSSARMELYDCVLQAESGDYASILEADNSFILISGCALGVKAREGVLAISRNSRGVISETEFLLDCQFIARALEAEISLPAIRNCLFSSQGRSQRSEAFGGGLFRQAIPLAIAGNVFRGLTHLTDAYPLDEIGRFNRDFGVSGEPNRAE